MAERKGRIKQGFLCYAGLLKHQTFLYIIGHLEDFSPKSLALLPVSARKDILSSIPVVDVQRLESTEFMKDINIEETWKNLYETRIPKNMQTALSDLFKNRPELDRVGLDLSWKDKFLLCGFDAATSSKFYRQGTLVVYLYKLLMFCVSKTNAPCFSCLPNTVENCFGLEGFVVLSALPSISRKAHDDLYSSLLSPMPRPTTQPTQQSAPLHNTIKDFPNVLEVMKFFIQYFSFRPRILLLQNVTILDVNQTALWPTIQLTGLTTPNTVGMLADFLKDVQVVCLRSRGWNAAKNLPVLRAIFQMLVTNRQRMLTAIVLDLLNIGTPSQNQLLGAIANTLTGLVFIPFHGHAQQRRGVYDTLTIFSIYLSLEAPEEMKHIDTIIRSQPQLEVLKVNCNHKSYVWNPRPFAVTVYNGLCETVTLSVFANPYLKHLELHQMVLSNSTLQNLLYHFLTSTSNCEQELTLSCLGILDSPCKSGAPICKPESGSDAGKHGSRSLKLRLCLFNREMSEWLAKFPKIRLQMLEINAANAADNLSAMITLSQLPCLEVEHVKISVISGQDIYVPLTKLFCSQQSDYFKKLSGELFVRDTRNEDILPLVSVIKGSMRILSRIHLGLSAIAVRNKQMFELLLQVLFQLPYLNEVTFVLASPGLRLSHLGSIFNLWEKEAHKNKFKSLCLLGDSSTRVSNLPVRFIEVLKSMTCHYCDPDACGCLINN